MATTKFYFDLRGKAKDGKGSVQVQLYHNGTTAYFPTGIRLTSQEWNGTMAVRVTGAETINANLQEQKTKIDKFVALLSFDDRYKTMTASDIKSEFGSAKPRKIQGHSISEVFAEYMNSGNLKEGTKIIYRTTLRKV